MEHVSVVLKNLSNNLPNQEINRIELTETFISQNTITSNIIRIFKLLFYANEFRCPGNPESRHAVLKTQAEKLRFRKIRKVV